MQLNIFSKPHKLGSSSYDYIRKFGMFAAFLLICLILSLATPNFFSLQNMNIVLRQVSINGILAIGVTFVIITGGIDLSLGSVVALAGVVAALFAHPGEYPLIVPIALALLVGAGIGGLTGLVSTKGRLASFIVSPGMMTIALRLALVLSEGRAVTTLADSYNATAGATFVGIAIPILVFALVIVVAILLLTHSRNGR